MTSSSPEHPTLQLPPERLIFLSCLYLGFPAILFFAGWLRAPWNVLGVALVAVLLWRLWPRSSSKNSERMNVKVFWWTLAPCLLALCFSGVGALVAQQADWHKHNAVLQDLVSRSWPVTYQVGAPEGGSFYLLYYGGFYLPISVVGRLLGTGAIAEATLLWSALGLALISAWIVFFTRGRAPWAGLLFVSFDGLKLFGSLLARALTHTGVLQEGALSSLSPNPAWWAGQPHFQFSSFFALLGVVPQHALSGWLGAALLGFAMFHPRARQTPFVLACIVPFCLLWSVFVGLACVPFVVIALWIRAKNKSDEHPTSPRQTTALFVIALTLTGVLGLYYAGRGSSALVQTIPTFPLLSWATNPARGFDFLLRFALWTTLEWALLFWLASRLRSRMKSRERAVWAPALFLLGFLPLLHVGAFNDLLMRGIIPAQFFLFLWIANALSGARLDGSSDDKPVVQSRPLKALLLALLCLGPINNLILFRPQAVVTVRHVRHLREPVSPEDRELNTLARWQKWNFDRTQGSLEPDFDPAGNPKEWQLYRSQYLGRTDSLWWRFLARHDDSGKGVRKELASSLTKP